MGSKIFNTPTDHENAADISAAVAKTASAGTRRRDLVASALLGVVGAGAVASLTTVPAEAASGAAVAWADTVLGVVTLPSSTGARTGDLASKNSSDLGNATLVIAKGGLKAGDGGGGLFYWESGNITGDNGGIIIVPNSNPSGRWIRVCSGPLNVKWFGASGNGAQDDTLAIKNAINALPINATSGAPTGAVHIPTGTYLVTSTLAITNDRTHIFGDGQWATSIIFNPQATQSPLFAFGKPSTVLYQCSLRQLSISSGNNVAKIGVRLTDTSVFTMDQVTIYNFTSSENTSIGILMQGREFTLISGLDCAADSPIRIGQNPHAPRNQDEDCDHAHLSDLYLTPAANRHCITIDNGTNVSNLVIDGTNAFVGGRDGLHWSDSSSIIASNNVSISNVRREGTIASGGWAVYISHNYALQNLRLENVTCDSSGMSLHNVKGATLDSCVFESKSQSDLALDSTCSEFEWANCFFQASGTASISGMTEVFSMPKIDTLAPLPPSGRLVNSTYASTTPSRAWGTSLIKHTGVLANGSTFRIPSINAGGYEVAIITIATHNPAFSISEGGVFLFSTQTVAALGATPNASTGNVSGKICLAWADSNNAYLINNLTHSVDYLISVEFK